MKYIIALNKKLETEDPNDFFSETEVKEIEALMDALNVDYRIINDEIAFVKTLSTIADIDSLVVLNLTRKGTFNNKKVLVNAYCDLRCITCISSSALSVNLARNKFLFPELLKAFGNFVPTNHTILALPSLFTNQEKVILKEIQGAASVNLDDNRIGSITMIDNKYYLNKILIDEQLLESHVLQEFIDGSEVEVPFIIKKGIVEILGVFEISFPDNQNYISQELSDSYDYTFTRCSTIDMDFVSDVVNHVVNKLGIEYYGRVDFRIGSYADTSTYKVFDIATTPYFIKSTSFQTAFDSDSKLQKHYRNILDLIFSTVD